MSNGSGQPSDTLSNQFTDPKVFEVTEIEVFEVFGILALRGEYDWRVWVDGRGNGICALFFVELVSVEFSKALVLDEESASYRIAVSSVST